MKTGSTVTYRDLEVRRIPFEFPDDIEPCWNPDKPEWSHMVNGASLAMPYLEPFLIKVVRLGLAHIEDPRLRAVANDYCGQEGQHYRQHRRFNDVLIGKGYPRLRELERRMEDTYAQFLERRSLKFHLAYAAGFESMALAVGHWLVDDREYLFGNADARVASLVLWHFVEELEHKEAAIGVYQHVFGDYAYRIFGIFYASVHLMGLSRRAYREMLRADGLWWNLGSRWRLWKMTGRFLSRVLPHMMRCCAPGHDPRRFEDPPWVADWITAYRQNNASVPVLDTRNLDARLACATGGPTSEGPA
jgi:predicted metal-dependent hydrolase